VNDEWMVVKSRDEEFVVRVGSAVIGQELHPGDQLVWDRDAGVVYGKIEKPTAQQYFLETTPQDTFESIGGLEKEIAIIQSTMEMHRNYPDVVGKFQLRRAGFILLYGPPGTGKTLLAKGLANWAARNSSSGRSRFMNIKPGALHSMWYSQSESNYREIFRTARQEVSRNPGVPLILFFDEIDSIGSSRGSSLAQTQDNVLMAFCAELDGLEARHDILVVGATNRRDVLDPALARPGRMGDLQLRVPRPNPIAARDILSKHLPANIPYARNGHGDDFAATREEILDTVVSRIFAPNADNALATITFRDGNHKTVRAGDMISGALLANMARIALERACQREVSSGKSGLEVRDLEEALCLEFDSVAKLLTPRNCRHHLDDLPQDMDVVKIEPAAGRGRRAHRYLHVA
jgi:proteasome-associated ATPase